MVILYIIHGPVIHGPCIWIEDRERIPAVLVLSLYSGWDGARSMDGVPTWLTRASVFKP